MLLVLEDNEAEPEAETGAICKPGLWVAGQTGKCSNTAVKWTCTVYVAADLQDNICVTNLQQQSHMQSVSGSEPVLFGNLSRLGNACSMCVHKDICALMVTVTSICRAAADLLQQLSLTLCAALMTMQRLCPCAVHIHLQASTWKGTWVG